MKQQQHKVHGMEIELVQAMNAVEKTGQGKVLGQRLLHASVLITVSLGCHCITLYCLKGDATFPSALAPCALVPNAIIVARLNLLSHSKMQPL